MSEIEWSTNAARVMMEQYQRLPQLWDRQHTLYRTTSAKNKAWMSLAKIFSCDMTELRKKFNSLQASYRRERSKVKEGGRSGWFLYSHMAFLPNYLPNPPPDAPPPPPPPHLQCTRLQEKEEEEAADETYEWPAEEPGALFRYESESEPEGARAGCERVKPERGARAGCERVKPEPDSPLHQDHQVSRNQRSAIDKRKRLTRTLKRRERPRELTQAYVESRLRHVQEATLRLVAGGAGAGAGAGGGARKDDCDTFGEYIAATLRKHDKKTQCLMKRAINSIVFDQEMRDYSSPLDAEMVTEMLDAEVGL